MVRNINIKQSAWIPNLGLAYSLTTLLPMFGFYDVISPPDMLKSDSLSTSIMTYIVYIFVCGFGGSRSISLLSNVVYRQFVKITFLSSGDPKTDITTIISKYDFCSITTK